MTKLTILDGGKTIGGAKIHLKTDGKALLLDFGLNYKKMNKYFEEYLRPRSTRGIHDLSSLGIIPHFDIYRDDLIPRDLSKDLDSLDVQCVLLSHAHFDHSGCIGLLREDIPVCCSVETAVLLKALRDTGRAGVHKEIPYCTPRKSFDDDERILPSSHWQKKEYHGRDFICVDLEKCVKERFREFWGNCPSGRGLKPGRITSLQEADVPFEIKSFPVSHSIYGATAYAVKTSAGWVAYTGDLRLHGTRGDMTEKSLEAISNLNPVVLLIDGTYAGKEKVRTTEREVYENCLAEARHEKGLIIGDVQPRHYERMETFAKIAEKTQRKLIITLRDWYILYYLSNTLRGESERQTARDIGNFLSSTFIYGKLEKSRSKWKKQTRDRFDQRIIDPRQIRDNPGTFLIMLNFWNIKHLLDIKVDGGLYIHSKSEAFTEEQEIDYRRLWNWLKHFNFDVVGFTMSGEKENVPEFAEGYHSSGHLSSSEILNVIEQVDPEIVVPVHTENPDFFSQNIEREVWIPKTSEKSLRI